VNAVTVCLVGCSGSNSDPVSPDGTEIAGDHLRRMRRIIEACAERDMVVVVGIFYQHAPFGLEDSSAVRAAVRRVTEHLRPYGNVVLNVANEHTSYGWDDTADVFDFRDPDRVVELCEVVHEADADRLVGGGGYHPETCAVIGRSAAADVVTFDTGQ
jgi:sugar phosphate isomerase/epimerase